MTAQGFKTALYAWLLLLATELQASALANYVNLPDTHYHWELVEQMEAEGYTVAHLELTSQQWRDHRWTHHIQVVRPPDVRNGHIALLLIAGDGRGTEHLEVLKLLSQRAGAIAAVVTNVPNQPFYGGLEEDALIAYTLQQYLKTGDDTWPLLFPMVKAATRAMDAVQAYTRQQYAQVIERFVVAGASKRGWTTWLTAAVDDRVEGIVPMVIDMLNIRAQTDWARKVYGTQSEKIHDYVDLGLVREDETLEMKQLRRWIDPYTYRDRLTMPKLLLLGTNDPYWTVDALRHYWEELSEPKLLFQMPNTGHDLAGGEAAFQTMAAFYQMIADNQDLPSMAWRFQLAEHGQARFGVRIDQPVKGIRLWRAQSVDRDFRDEPWSCRALDIKSGSAQASVELSTPERGYHAYMLEVLLTTPRGYSYRLSTEVKVTPDAVR